MLGLRISILLLALAGCSVADRFADRATRYNLEAEQVRSQGLLLNIVRAAYRKPLQFSDLTTVTGQATASAGIGTLLPLGGPASAYQANPTTSLSGGPSFTATTLNTKAFYDGILAPIPVRMLATYMHAGYPTKLLLMLMVREIEVSGGVHSAVYDNGLLARDPVAADRFEQVLDDLVAAGLSTEQVVKRWGPRLAANQFAQFDAVAKLQTQNLDLEEAHDSNGKPTYQVTQTMNDYIFCFDAAGAAPPSAYLSDALLAGNRCGTGERPERQPGRERLSIRLRSTMGLIYFLGEIARVELGLLSGREAYVPSFHIFDRDRRPVPNQLFVIRFGQDDPTLSVDYGSKAFSIHADPNARDHSSQVLDLTLQLLSVNSDAKDFPSANTVTLIGR